MEFLRGKNIVVYDLEIKKRIEDCTNGWQSHDEMGISIGCAYDYRDSRFKIFADDNISKLTDRLNEPNTIIVAFNQIGFDNRLMRASGQNLKPDSELFNYDMLLESREAAGAVGFIKGFKLDDHLRILKLPMKTADGAQAPIMWQSGRIGELIDYCLNDVTQEKNLFEYIIRNQRLACEYNPNGYQVKLPGFLVKSFFAIK